MKKIQFISIVLSTAALVFFILNQLNPVHSLERVTQATLSAENQIYQTGKQTAQITLKSLRSVTSGPEIRPVSDFAPKVEQVRAEVRKNPEAIPTSLLYFASKLGKRFQNARLSLANATGFFDDLNSCLETSKPIAISAKALCLREGERLTHYYPVLQGNFELLAQKATPEVRNLAMLHARASQ